ncbi:MAG TPA: response regulator [Gaiellaceae bacterium]|nr:response regulator [Gaiellaceae bacterium]
MTTEPRPCVLVADDSREFAALVGATLEEAGFDVVTVYSGPAAIAAMRDNDVAAAVLDVLMPGIAGDAVADRLRRIRPGLPILLMTGDAGKQFVKAADLPVLLKPFRHEELVDALRRLLGLAD